MLQPRAARKAVSGAGGTAVAAAGECVWRQCCGEIAREGSARMSVTTSAAAVCTPPPHRAHCARCDGDVLCVGGRRPLRRVGGGSGSKAAWREAAEAVGRTARQRQGRGSGGLGGSGSRCNRPRRARATMCSACVRLGGGRTPLALRQVSNNLVGASCTCSQKFLLMRAVTGIGHTCDGREKSGGCRIYHVY